MDDVHQAPITYGTGGGRHLERTTRGISKSTHLGVDDAVEGFVELEQDLHAVCFTRDVQSEDLRGVLRPNQV